MALKYKRILLKLSGEVLKGSSASCHDETILAEVAQPFDAREAIRLMGQGTVALFAGDTGNPFFSTDSGAVAPTPSSRPPRSMASTPPTPPQAASPNPMALRGTTSRVPTSSLNSPIPMGRRLLGIMKPTETY